MVDKYKTIDLCAGIGGIRRGFEMTGQFENVLSAEIDTYAAKTYLHLFDEDPTNDLTAEEFKKKAKDTEYDILLAGFPCQAFSSVGKKLGFDDVTRGTVFFHIKEIISETKPKAVFLENVQNIISHDKGRTINTIINVLERELNYKIIGVEEKDDGNFSFSSKSFIRNTKHFGLPQNRPRTYIMAFSRAYFGPAVLKIKDKELPTKGKELIFKTVQDVLDSNVDDKYYMASGYLDTLKKHKIRQKGMGNGFGYCVVNSEKRKNQYANTIMATGGSGKERNLVYQPKKGVEDRKLPGKKTSINNEGIRVMTPIEWGRLQGFVGYAFVRDGIETFSFPEGLSDAQKYKQFGNSVSIPVIKTMAVFMHHCFEIMMNSREKKIYDYIGEKKAITRKDIMDHFNMSYQQANYILKRMVDNNYVSMKRIGTKQQFERIESNEYQNT